MLEAVVPVAVVGVVVVVIIVVAVVVVAVVVLVCHEAAKWLFKAARARGAGERVLWEDSKAYTRFL